MLQRLTQRAGLLATIRTGQLVPVSEALVSRPQRSPALQQPQQRSRISPGGQHAAVLSDHTSLQIVRLAPGSQEPAPMTAELPASSAVSMAFSRTGRLFGVVLAQPVADASGGYRLSSRLLHLEDASWTADCAHNRISVPERPAHHLAFSQDDRYAACTLGTASTTTGVLIFAVSERTEWELLPLQLGSLGELVDARWEGGVLMVLCSQGVLAISVNAPGSTQGPLRLSCQRVPLPGLTIVGQDYSYSGPDVSFAVLKPHRDRPQAGIARMVLHPCPRLRSTHLKDWDSDSLPDAGSEAASLVLCCERQARVWTRYCNTSHAFSVPGLTLPNWNYHDAHYLAGVQDSAVVVLDRAGATVAEWRPSCQHKQLDALTLVNMFWASDSPQRLVVQCAVGDEQDGVWPSTLFTLLEFQ